MMELVPRASAAVPQTLAQSLMELPFGSQAQVCVGDGRLAAFLAFVAYDRNIGVVKYALRVLNNTALAAQAKMFVETKGVQVSAYPLAVDVAPYSMRDDIIPVRIDVTGWYDRAIVHVTTEQSVFTVDAPPPTRERPRWTKWSALCAIPLLLIGAAQLGQPRVLDVSAPQRALAGSSIRVPVQVSGVGSVEYDFDTRDGLQLAAGLTSQSDVVQLRIPGDGVGAPYVLHVRMRNAFFRDERTASIAAVIPPKPQKPAAAQSSILIDNLAVSPSPAQAGSHIDVHYATNAQAGDVWLLDSTGATWAHAPLSVTGMTTLNLPLAAAGKQMRVVLHAQSGKQHAQSSVGLTVVPSQQIAAQASQPAPPAKPAPRPRRSSADLELSSQVVSAGDSVTVNVTGTDGDVRIALESSSGTTMAEGDSDEGQGVTLNAPNVNTPTTFYVIATFTNGITQQSIVKRLVVTPR